MKIEFLTIEEVLPIRHVVLWPNKPLSFSRLGDDEYGDHFGVKVDGHVVCVASVFTKSGKARLRKFATIKDYQGKGIGSMVIKYLIKAYKSKGVWLFWFDAREESIPFYERFGFSVEGERFYKCEQAYFKMVKILV